MSKRKAEVNDIIYELDSEDLSSSSDEDKNTKKACTKTITASAIEEAKVEKPEDNLNIVKQAAPTESSQESTLDENGGKSPSTEVQPIKKHTETNITDPTETTDIVDQSNIVVLNNGNDTIISINDSLTEEIPFECPKESTDSVILNEDMDTKTDSPSSRQISIGCANRSPLVSMTFKNKKLAKDYKQKIKEFMLKLIRLHDEDSLIGSESETDLELDIWPEDLVDNIENVQQKVTEAETDSFFFVDTDPGYAAHNDVPQYRKIDLVLSEKPEDEPVPSVQLRRVQTCFNCDGEHQLRDCTVPRNNAKINERRRAVNANRVGRYHVEDDQKFGHLVPGRVSGALRLALGLRRDELPLHVYRMRLLGYPPGWLEDARISHSGITMFDSEGQAIQDPEEEDGELSEPGARDKYDIKKILDFPGYNVPASSRYKEESHRYGLPPLSDEDSKMNMLQVLAPNAMKAYKRKKLTFFPSASASSPNCTILGQAEMELDDDDELADFPSVPPLPDEAPPPAPLPPPPPGSPPPPPPGASPPPPLPPTDTNNKSEETRAEDTEDTKSEDTKDTTSDDLVVVDVMQVKDIPVPVVEVIDLDDSNTQSSGGRDSPSLQDLITKKRLLLEALETPPSTPNSPAKKVKVSLESDKADTVSEIEIAINEKSEIAAEETKVADTEESNTKIQTESRKEADSNPQTPKAGHVKATSYGTPVLNTASPFLKLPSDNNFAKDICDIINFENLPDSTGKYGKISSMLKRVKSEVDRIQDS